MSNTSERTVRLRLICANLPPVECDGKNTVFGLQDKQRVLQMGKRRADGAFIYECELRAKPSTNNTINFLGEYAHGTPTTRFLYLSYRLADGKLEEWIKRIKIPLKGIHWEQVEQADATQQVLEAVVEGSRSGTVSPNGGWQLTSK